MTTDEEIKRGNNAARIINDPLFAEAVDAVRGRLLTIMETAKTDEATLQAKTCLGLLADIKQHLVRVMTDGRIAAESIKLEQDKRSWWHRAA